MADYRVLIVDDQRDVRRVLRSGLETLQQEIEITDVPSGEEAILVISRQPVDLLVTDVRLPGISGLELYERTQVRNPNLKFILITGVSQPKVQRQVANAGADAFFFKPIDLDEFLDAVKSCLGISDFTAPKETAEIEAEDTLPTLSGRLAILHQDAEASAIFLLDGFGEIVAQTETLPDTIISPTFVSSLMAASSAAAKVAALINADAFKDLMYFAGEPYDFVLSHVSDGMILLVVLPQAGEDDKLLFKWTRVVRPAVKDLRHILAVMGVSVEEPEQLQTTVKEDELEAEIDVSQVLPEIDALFEQAGKADIKPQDINDFWETMVSDSDVQEQISSSDSITYDQAQQLGLTPEEE